MKKIYLYLTILTLISCKKDKNVTDNDTSNMPLLHSELITNPGIYDNEGRYVVLRGVNYNVLGDYWIGNEALPPTKQYEADDFKAMAKYGVNCVRLLFNWSKLEPQRGVYNQAYIQEIKKAIEDAAKHNIYVLVDMHQDAWGKYIVSSVLDSCAFPNKGWDGAPLWATLTEGKSTCTNNGARESAPAVVQSFQNFWDNKEGIQDACIAAWQELVKNIAMYNNVLGYDILNEPSLGYKPIDQEAKKLGAFYDKAIQGIRVAEKSVGDKSHIAFFEMTIQWSGNPIPFIPLAGFTQDKNIMFAPHSYFEAISYELTIEQGFNLIKTLGKIYGSNILIGEWGFFGDPATDVTKVKRFARMEDDILASSTWWQWSQSPGDPHGISWDGTQYGNTSMALVELDKNANLTGNVNTIYLNVLSRARPLAIHGKFNKFSSDVDSGKMKLEATTDKTGNTTIWIPNRFGTPKFQLNNALVDDSTIVEGGFIYSFETKDNYSIEVYY
jgi:endoglycosylceramidase